MRIRYQRLTRHFQRGDRLFPRDGRKRVQKDFEAVSGLEVVEEILHRYSRARKYRRSPEDLGVYGDDHLGTAGCHAQYVT